MPFPIKFGLSVAVALAAIAGWFFMGYLGQAGPQGAVAFLGPFMVVSLWIFPEVMRSRSDGRTPRHQLKGAQR
jgi:membrane protein YdbS with pleckstrin-like domain